MKKDIQKKLHHVTPVLELAIGTCVLLACIIGVIGVVFSTQFTQLFQSPSYFQEWLNAICYFVIGIEFVKMISSHTVDAVVDVLLVALARQMVVEHTAPFDSLLIILAVSILFVVRKYLYISKNNNTHTPSCSHPKST